MGNNNFQNIGPQLQETTEAPTSILALAARLLLLFVAILQPVESFAACTLKAAPVCLDTPATPPCKTVQDPTSPNNPLATVEICLKSHPKIGALTSTATCWEYASSYDCMSATPTTFTDTCAPIKTNKNADGTLACDGYQETSSKCATDGLNAAGVCNTFDVTYRCIAQAGIPYTQQDCNGVKICTNGVCTIGVKEKNAAYTKVAAEAETARRAGFYADKTSAVGTDPSTIKVFNGEVNKCNINTNGWANCCDKKSGAQNNQALANAFIQAGVASWASNVIGSQNSYDALFAQGSKYLDQAMTGMQEVLSRWSDAGTTLTTTATTTATAATTTTATAAATATASATPTAGVPTQPLGASIGGTIGGIAGSMAAGQLAANNGANAQWTSAFAAMGNTLGTIAGNYAGAYVTGATTAAYATVAAGGEASAAMSMASMGGSSSMAAVSINPGLLTAVLVVALIMAALSCTPDEAITQLKLGTGNCHHVGSYCDFKDILGGCQTQRHSYCCYNDKLAKIINVQGRALLPASMAKPWDPAGDAKNPDCTGLTLTQLSSIDLSKIDLTEFAKELYAKNIPTKQDLVDKVTNQINAFYAANNADPYLTSGRISTPKTATGQNITISSTAPNTGVFVNNYDPGSCLVAFAPSIPAADGSVLGTFTITGCREVKPDGTKAPSFDFFYRFSIRV